MTPSQFLSLTLILAALFVAEWLFIRLARRYGLHDKANSRSSHTGVIVRGGGIIFYLAAVLHLLIWQSNTYFFIGLTVISTIGFWDDISSLSPRFRLIFQTLAATLLLLATEVSIAWWLFPVGLFVVVGIVNAYNFMDGINGITAGYSLVTLLTLGFISYQTHPLDTPLIGCTLLSLVVFSVFNFRHKARCFAGDIGSNSIAYIIVFLLAVLILQTGDWTALMLLNVYGVDSCMTILYRLKNGENIAAAHRQHNYQLLANELGLKHITVSIIYMGLQAFLNGIYLTLELPTYKVVYAIATTGILAVAYILLRRKYGYLLAQKAMSASCGDPTKQTA